MVHLWTVTQIRQQGRFQGIEDGAHIYTYQGKMWALIPRFGYIEIRQVLGEE